MRYVAAFCLGALALGLIEAGIEMTPGAGMVCGVFHITTALLVVVCSLVIWRVGVESISAPTSPRPARERAEEATEVAESILRREGLDSPKRGYREVEVGAARVVKEVEEEEEGYW